LSPLCCLSLAEIKPEHTDGVIRQKLALVECARLPERAATDTIAYVVTDSQGLTRTSTRTVIIQVAANDNSPAAADDNQATTTTDATSQ
jgi:hypothetical protein